MKPGIFRETMIALRTGIYTNDYGKVAETMMELSQEEKQYIWEKLKDFPWERTMIKDMEKMYE